MKHPKQYDTDIATSKRMASVKLKRGKEERMLSKALWHRGYKYRLNYKKLPGSPDIAITKYNVAIFVDGEFWHGKDWDKRKDRLKRNKEYWSEKIEENMRRDLKVDKELKQMGWISVRLWSKQVSDHLDECIEEIEELIRSIENEKEYILYSADLM